MAVSAADMYCKKNAMYVDRHAYAFLLFTVKKKKKCCAIVALNSFLPAE
jgi:hypothetical protein